MTMGREEAIKLLHEILDQCCETANILCTEDADKRCDALDIAIEALSKPNKFVNRPIGEWINKGNYAECSICGAHSGIQFDGVEPVPLKTKFCHNCGAEMKIPLYMYASWDRSEE